MSIRPYYLCHGHRLSKNQPLTELTGSFVLNDGKERHCVRLVENIQLIHSTDEQAKTTRFAVIHESSKNNSTSCTSVEYSNLTKEEGIAKLRELLKKNTDIPIDNQPFSFVNNTTLNPDLRDTLHFRKLKQIDEKWRTQYKSLSTQEDQRLRYQIKGKGLNLVKNARLWRVPYTDSTSAHSLVRGIQWRFVQAFSGFETIMLSDAMLDSRYKSDKAPGFARLFYSWELQKTFGESVHLLQNTYLKQYIQNWRLTHPEPIVIDDWFLEFLNPNSNGKAALSKLEDPNITHEWKDGISLASALRNLTAHGALSPTQTIEQGLVPIYLQLTALIVQCSYAAVSSELTSESKPV